MTGLDFTAPEWPIWTPVDGALTHITDREPPDPDDDEDAQAGLPILATDGNGNYIRSDFRGLWYRTNWAGVALRDADGLMPGILKLRIQLAEDATHTVIAAAVVVWNMPRVGVCYRKITEMFELADGTRRVGNEWHMPDGMAWLDSKARVHRPAV